MPSHHPPARPLEEEAKRFHRWTRSTRQRPAEWGACYPHWRDAYAAVDLTLAEGLLNPDTTRQLLFLLVGDSANERVLELLAACPMGGFQVAEQGTLHARPEVRRQAALLLGRLATLGSIELLRGLTGDPDAGVRECARAALRPLDPAFIERLAGAE